MSWPVTWPDPAAAALLNPAVRLLAEKYAVASLTALTLHRVGGNPITILPAARPLVTGRYVRLTGWPEGTFYPGTSYPGLLYPSAEQLSALVTVDTVEAVPLPGPVGTVTEVKIDGVVVPSTAYRIEGGEYLVRIDGKAWPVLSGDNFTVTYYNTHPVNALGEHAAGVMANEWLKLITGDKKCRLPSSVTTVSRQGINYEVAKGMFPEGVTGIPEVDMFLLQYNPFALKVLPRVYSPDLPRHRQVWHA